MPSGASGRVVAITGGASGIGAATARLLAGQGQRVVVLDREAGAAVTEVGAQDASFVSVDVTQPDLVAAAFEQIFNTYGRLDGLVNSAGIESRALLPQMSADQWDRVMNVNLKGTMLCTQAAAALIKRGGGGAIVNVASIAGKRMSYSGDSAYTASKGAVLAFTRHAAFELAADNVRVNAVCPGPTLTPMIHRSLSQQRIDAVVQTVPLGRWVQPDDVAHAIGFFLGDGAAMCTGTTLDVDGGVLVSNGSSYPDYFAARQ